MRNTLRKPRSGDVETELERLPSYTSTLSQAPQPETAHINRGGSSGEPLPAYTPTANTSLTQDMKAAQKSQRPEPEPTTINNYVDMEANQPNSNASDPAIAAANRSAAAGLANNRALIFGCALVGMIYSSVCLLFVLHKWDYVELKDDSRVRIAELAFVVWSLPLVSLPAYVCSYHPPVAERRKFARCIIIVFCISTLLPLVSHVIYTAAGPTPDYDYLVNGTTTSYKSAVLANGTAPTDMTAMYNLAARALFL